MRSHHMFALAALMLAAAYATTSFQPTVTGATPLVAGTALKGAPPEVTSTLRRACLDCHSDETRWPWYSSLPPASWLIKRDIDQARRQVNFSRWAGYNRFDRADMLSRVCELAAKRQMPPWQYRLLHRDARLNIIDVRSLCEWTQTESTRLVEADDDRAQ